MVDEMILQAVIERRLMQEGHVVSSVGHVREAIDRLGKDSYDVVLCDLHSSAGDGAELLQWLGSYRPSIPALVICEAISSEFRTEYETGGGSVRIIEKPIDLDKLVSMVEECGPRRGFYGNDIEIEFFDYVQMIALTGRDKAILVHTNAGVGRIWFEHGDICHVQMGEERGEGAFYKILGLDQGTFRETLFRPPPARTVMRPSMHLLMEAARRKDEGLLGLTEEEVKRIGAENAAREMARKAAKKAAKKAAAEASQPVAAPEPAPPPIPEPEPEPAPPPRPRVQPTTPPPRPRTEVTSVTEDVMARLDFLTDDDEDGATASTRQQPRPAPEPEPAPEPRRPRQAPPEPAADSSTSNASAASASASTSQGDGVPVMRRRVKTLERVVSKPHKKAKIQDLTVRARPEEQPDPAAPKGKAVTADVMDDPETRDLMLGQFWQFEGVDGVAIISSTGKVIAEDMRNNNNAVTLAGFYMRGAARIARTLGYNVFDGVIARSTNNQQMIMVGMGATSAVLSVATGFEPEVIRDAIMGVGS
ncbi:MAG: response regulator [Myxococcales bacterium]|nr:response regulator [Myxococcales bacterium]